MKLALPSHLARALFLGLALASACTSDRDEGDREDADDRDDRDDRDDVTSEGEGEPSEGEGEGPSEGEGEGPFEGEGEGEGEGEAPPEEPDSPLELRSADEVCAAWSGFAWFQGDEWLPVGDGTDACDVGFMPEGAQDAAVARVNLYRWLAGLPPVALAEGLIEQEQACASVLVGVGSLQHHPPPSAPCWSDAGAAGAGSSNLAQGTSATTSVDLFVEDPVLSLGHRRWVLNPAAVETAFGHKGSFTCMYSFSNHGAFDTGFVSWPPPGPLPVGAAIGRTSFGTSHYALTEETRVDVAIDGGPFVQVAFDDLGWGYGSLSTTIAFDLPGISPWDVATNGREVSVRISGLQGDGDVVAWTTRYVDCP